MATIECTACGADIPAGSTFCPYCGSPAVTEEQNPPANPPSPEEEAPLPANHEPSPDDTAEESADSDRMTWDDFNSDESDEDVYQPPAEEEEEESEAEEESSDSSSKPEKPKKVRAPRRHRPIGLRILCGFVSTILLFFSISIGIATGALLMVKDITSADTIRQMINEIDLTEMEFTLNGEKVTATDMVHTALEEAQQQLGGEEIISQERVDELLESDMVKDLLSDTVGGMADGLLGDPESADMTPEEVRTFMEDNRDEISEVLGVELSDAMIDNVMNEITETQVLEKFSASKLLEQAPQLQSFTFFISNTIIGALFVVMLVFLLLIALINGFRPISLSYAGITFLTVGGLFGAISYAIDYVVEMIIEMTGLSANVLNVAVIGIVSGADYVCKIGLITGVALIVSAIGYTILRAILRRRSA